MNRAPQIGLIPRSPISPLSFSEERKNEEGKKEEKKRALIRETRKVGVHLGDRGIALPALLLRLIMKGECDA